MRLLIINLIIFSGLTNDVLNFWMCGKELVCSSFGNAWCKLPYLHISRFYWKKEWDMVFCCSMYSNRWCVHFTNLVSLFTIFFFEQLFTITLSWPIVTPPSSRKSILRINQYKTWGYKNSINWKIKVNQTSHNNLSLSHHIIVITTHLLKLNL